MTNIDIKIIGSANFAQIEQAVGRLKASLSQLQTQMNAPGTSGMFSQMQKEIRAFNKELEASGAFKVYAREASSAADRLTERLQKNKITFNDLRMAMQKVNREGNLFAEIGKKQIAIQSAQAIQVGKTAYVYESLSTSTRNATRAALENAAAINAQNAALKRAAIEVINTGKNFQWTGRQLTMGITMPIAMLGTATATMFNDIDKNLTKLAKVYGVGLTQPTEQAIATIRKQVLALSTELGKTLGISASEVTDIAQQFAAAGLQGKQLIEATKQAARIVVLGEADKQEAITATISLQTAYKLNTQQLTEAVNFFNAAQAATSTSMGDLINAIPRVGPIIKGLGGSYKDMVAILTALKEGGVPASEAANAIKNSLGRIINPTAAAKKELMSFGIDLEGIVNKNAGNLVKTLLDLQGGLLKLDNLSRQRAISELFGKYQFARMAAFIENFNRAGSQSEKIMKMMGLSFGELANIADKQTKKIQQSASGRFKIAVETLKNTLLPVGEMFLRVFTPILNTITDLVKAVSNLPDPVKNFLKLVGALTVGVGPVIMAFGLFGNLLGSVGLGLIKLKQILGAFRQLFGAGGFDAFKMLLGGMKDFDPVSTRATKAVKLFQEGTVSAEKATQIFTSSIDALIQRLNALQGASTNARRSILDITGAEASANASGSSYYLPIGAGNRNAMGGTEISHLLPKAQSLQSDPLLLRLIQRAGIDPSYATGGNLLRGAATYLPRNSVATEVQQAIGDKVFGFASSPETRTSDILSLLPASKRQEFALKLQSMEQGLQARILPTFEEHAKSIAQYETIMQKIFSSGSGSVKEFTDKLKQYQSSGLTQLEAEQRALTEAFQLSDKSMQRGIQDRINYYKTLQERYGLTPEQTLTIMQRRSLRSELALRNKYGIGNFSSEAGKDRFGRLRVALDNLAYQDMQSISTPQERMNAIRARREQLMIERGWTQDIRTRQWVPPVKQQDLPKQQGGFMGKVAGGLGAAGMLASMGMMAFGGGNETTNNALMGVSSAGMLGSLLPAQGAFAATGPIGIGLMATVAALPLVIQGFNALRKQADITTKSIYAGFSTSNSEAQIFGIKLNRLSDISFKKLTGAAKQTNDEIGRMADQINQLGEQDPLKAFTDKLSGKSLDERIKALTSKYLTYRVQGMSDEEARKNVTAIMRASRTEATTAGAFGLSANKLKGLSPTELFALQQKNIASGLQETTGAFRYQTVSNEYGRFGQTRRLVGINAYTNEAARQALNENVRNLATMISKPGYDMMQSFTAIANSFKKGTPEMAVFQQTIKQLYTTLGKEGKDAFKQLADQGVSAGDKLALFKLRMEGIISTTDQWNRAIQSASYRTQLINYARVQGQMTTAEETLATSLKAGRRTEYTTGGNTAAQKASAGYDKQIAAQQKVLDKLQAELDLRNKINDAQEKSLSFQNTQADMQQKYAEAISKGNFAEAAKLQRDMNLELVKYNSEIDRAAKQDKLDAANKKLEKLQKSKSAADQKISQSAQSYTTTIDDAVSNVTKKITDLLVTTGNVSEKTINKMASDIKDQYGGSFESAKTAIKSFISTMSGISELGIGRNIAADQQLGLNATQQSAVALAALKYFNEGKYTDYREAAAKALTDVIGIQFGFNPAKSQFYYLQGGGERQRSVYLGKSIEDVFRNKKAAGGHITGPGTSTSDSIPALLSNGEYVIKASSVQRYGKETFDALNAQKFADGGIVKGKIWSPLYGWVNDSTGSSKTQMRNYNLNKYSGLTSSIKSEGGSGILGMMLSDLWKLTDRDTWTGLLEYAKSQPMDALREFSGISSINRLIRNDYPKGTRGQANASWDMLAIFPLLAAASKAGKIAKLIKPSNLRQGMENIKLIKSLYGVEDLEHNLKNPNPDKNWGAAFSTRREPNAFRVDQTFRLTPKQLLQVFRSKGFLEADPYKLKYSSEWSKLLESGYLGIKSKDTFYSPFFMRGENPQRLPVFGRADLLDNFATRLRKNEKFVASARKWKVGVTRGEQSALANELEKGMMFGRSKKPQTMYRSGMIAAHELKVGQQIDLNGLNSFSTRRGAAAAIAEDNIRGLHGQIPSDMAHVIWEVEVPQGIPRIPIDEILTPRQKFVSAKGALGQSRILDEGESIFKNVRLTISDISKNENGIISVKAKIERMRGIPKVQAKFQPKRDASVFDIDDTIVETITGVGRDWPQVTAERGRPLMNQIHAILEAQARGDQIVFLTARHKYAEAATRALLERFGIKDYKLRMRGGPNEPKAVPDFKIQVLKELERLYNIRQIFDDSPENIVAMQQAGYRIKIPIEQVDKIPVSQIEKPVNDLIKPLGGRAGIFQALTSGKITLKSLGLERSHFAPGEHGFMMWLPRLINQNMKSGSKGVTAGNILSALTDTEKIIDPMSMIKEILFRISGDRKFAAGQIDPIYNAMKLKLSKLDKNRLFVNTTPEQSFEHWTAQQILPMFKNIKLPNGKTLYDELMDIKTVRTSGKSEGVIRLSTGETYYANKASGIAGKFNVPRVLLGNRGGLNIKSDAELLKSLFGWSGGGFVDIPKYHSGGYVNTKYGSEILAKLQGGEYVIPKEIVKHMANNSQSVYNNNPNITINVASTNASPQEIANAVSNAMQRRDNMVRTRTVIR